MNVNQTFHPRPLILSEIDLDKELGIVPLFVPAQSPPKAPQRQRLFIKGPIPFDWLRQANAMGGSTGLVAVALWFYVGLQGARSFKLDGRLDQLCGLTRQTRDQCLRRLQTAGLIHLRKRHGSYPSVQIIDPGG